MFDTLFIGTSGLLGHAKGLRIVGNNLANVNTPGYKSSQLQFADLFEQGGGGALAGGGSADGASKGVGVGTLATKVMFRAGTDQSTGNALDLSINGNGLFTVKRDDKLLYTRAGEFQFNAENILTNSAGDKVQALDSKGQLADISLQALERNAPKATATVKLAGNLTTTVATPAVDSGLNGVTVIDANGVSHSVNLTVKDTGGGNYTVSAVDAAGGAALTVAGALKFVGGAPVAGLGAVHLSYASAGVPAFLVKLDFGAVLNGAQASALNMQSQDGYLAGVRTDQSIAADGTVTVRYSNGQTAKGPRLALAEFQSEADLVQQGGVFERKAGAAVRYGYAGDDSLGKLMAGHREGSNVDLAEEFGNLILMQRGYQASSHVISTANDMIQELFDMKGHR